MNEIKPCNFNGVHILQCSFHTAGEKKPCIQNILFTCERNKHKSFLMLNQQKEQTLTRTRTSLSTGGLERIYKQSPAYTHCPDEAE